MSVQNLLYIITHAPYSNAAGQEALDAILIGAAFEQTVSVLFMHDGVFQLQENQSIEGSPLKQFTKTYSALTDFDVDNIFVLSSSLLSRGVEVSDLIVHAQVLDTQGVSDLIKGQFRVFTF